jgi:hypothetical protein
MKSLKESTAARTMHGIASSSEGNCEAGSDGLPASCWH